MIFWPGGSRWTVAKVPISLRATFSKCIFTICHDRVGGDSGAVSVPCPSSYGRKRIETLGVGAGAKGGHEVQRKSKRCPPGSQGIWEKSRQGRTEPLWSNFLMEENEGYY